MGCRHSLSKEAREQRNIGVVSDVAFSYTDVVDIQSSLWNILVSSEDGHTVRTPADVRGMTGVVAKCSDDAGYYAPSMEDLAWRIISDVEERGLNLTDAHYIQKLETEDEVLRLILSDTSSLRSETLEILLMWYVTTADCTSMLAHLDASVAAQRPARSASAQRDAERAGTDHDDDCDDDDDECCNDYDEPPIVPGTAESYQSFVWRGSPDVAASQANLSFASHTAPGMEPGSSPRSPAGGVCAHTPPRSHVSGTPVVGSGGCGGGATGGVCGSVPALGQLPVIPSASLGSSTPLHLPRDDSGCKTPDGNTSLQKSRQNSIQSSLRGSRLSRMIIPTTDPAMAKLVKRLMGSHNQANIEQLAFTLRGAMRTALRRFSTSGHDEASIRLKSEAQLIAGAEWSRDRAAAIARCGSLSEIPSAGGCCLLVPPSRSHSLTVVLDLDETLVYARRGPLWVRPGVPPFLRALNAMGCEVVCWTASNRSYAGGILSRLDPLGELVSQCIYSHPRWTVRKHGPQVKNLSLIGRDLRTTIIVDNLPDSVAGNETNAIVVENYEGCELHDTTLATLSKIISDIVSSGRTVPSFLLDRAATSSYLRLTERSLHDGNTISCFMLNSEPASFSLTL